MRVFLWVSIELVNWVSECEWASVGLAYVCVCARTIKGEHIHINFCLSFDKWIKPKRMISLRVSATANPIAPPPPAPQQPASARPQAGLQMASVPYRRPSWLSAGRNNDNGKKTEIDKRLSASLPRNGVGVGRRRGGGGSGGEGKGGRGGEERGGKGKKGAGGDGKGGEWR